MNSDQNLQNNSPTYPNRTVGNPEPFARSVDPLQSTEIQTEDVRTDFQEEVLQLLEERVVVDRSKRKVGEVIVRKVVETVMVQVPIRHERLIVEQVGAETKQLASIDLSQGEITGLELNNGVSNGEISNGSSNLISQPAPSSSSASSSMVTVSFSSIEAAHQALAELAAQTSHDQPTRIDISMPSSDALRYQNWISRSRL